MQSAYISYLHPQTINILLFCSHNKTKKQQTDCETKQKINFFSSQFTITITFLFEKI